MHSAQRSHKLISTEKTYFLRGVHNSSIITKLKHSQHCRKYRKREEEREALKYKRKQKNISELIIARVQLSGCTRHDPAVLLSCYQMNIEMTRD